MNIKNLIIVPTIEMSREQWLAFRSPKIHVNDFIRLNTEKSLDVLSFTDDERNDENANALLELFKSDLWQQYTFPCIGASEMSTIVGLNPYKSSIELFYEKVGIKPTPAFDNAAMFWGRELEEQIAEKWQYWQGDEQSMIDNYNEGKIVRKCRRLNAYLLNKNFPFIFASIDRIINKQTLSKTNIIDEGVLECKTISGFAADQWEMGFPPSYVIQIQTQLLVSELQFGESATLKDGRYFDCLPFDRNENLCNSIKERASKFYNNVKTAIEYYFLSLASYSERMRNENLAVVDTFSPEPDGSVSYENYLKDRFKDDFGTSRQGTPDELVLAREHELFKIKIDELEDFKRICSNKIKNSMQETQTLTFDEGKITWKANKNGSRVFKVSLR